MRVMKFGGSSLADLERVERVADILVERSGKGQLAVVLSAPGKTTNNIVEAVDCNCSGASDNDALSRVKATFRHIVDGLANKYPAFDKGASRCCVGCGIRIGHSHTQWRKFTRAMS